MDPQPWDGIGHCEIRARPFAIVGVRVLVPFPVLAVAISADAYCSPLVNGG